MEEHKMCLVTKPSILFESVLILRLIMPLFCLCTRWFHSFMNEPNKNYTRVYKTILFPQTLFFLRCIIHDKCSLEKHRVTVRLIERNYLHAINRFHCTRIIALFVLWNFYFINLKYFLFYKIVLFFGLLILEIMITTII